MAEKEVKDWPDNDDNLQRFNLKKLIQKLETARGSGTSMLSIMIPPGGGQLARMTKLLTDEFGVASNIKSKPNRLSVLSAIVSVQQKIALYNKLPPNGLALFCGTILNEEGKEKKIIIDFEPLEKINHSLYICGSKFEVDPLKSMLRNEQRFGFIIVDGHGCLFGLVCGNSRQVLHRFSVMLPRKHARGGQSAARFSRQRDELRNNYVRKVAEQAELVFLGSAREKAAKIDGLVLAGSANFKTALRSSPLLNACLKELVLLEVDVSYGGISGFNEAIELSSDVLGNLRLISEKKILSKFFETLALTPDLCCVGVKDCMSVLRSGAIDTLIVWQNLNVERCLLRNRVTGDDRIVYKDANETLKRDQYFEKSSGSELELIEKCDLIDWLMEHYKEFGLKLEMVGDSSSEGHQLALGLGGMGAHLRYPVDSLLSFSIDSESSDSDDS